jgi:hypothetical protein
MHSPITLALAALLVAGGAAAQAAEPFRPPPPHEVEPGARSWAACGIASLEGFGRNPSAREMRCRFGAEGPGRFGLLSYLDIPVYRPATPLPGTHTVGVPGMPRPALGESYEQWEWRVLRTSFGPEVRRVYSDLLQLDPIFLSRIRDFETELRRRGIPVRRRETYRTAERQAWIFQQGRSRPGPFATTTLTSWHCRVDRLGRPAARAVDYDVPASQMPRFHAIAEEVGLHSYGADSNDPGHVYLPDTDAASPMEIAVLRTLPRVMHVTLATGRPEDEWQERGAVERWRGATRDFLARPVPHYPAPEMPWMRLPERL